MCKTRVKVEPCLENVTKYNTYNRCKIDKFCLNNNMFFARCTWVSFTFIFSLKVNMTLTEPTLSELSFTEHKAKTHKISNNHIYHSVSDVLDCKCCKCDPQKNNRNLIVLNCCKLLTDFKIKPVY